MTGPAEPGGADREAQHDGPAAAAAAGVDGTPAGAEIDRVLAVADADGALAAAVLPLVGGAANVAWVGACSSRLRLVLRDDTARDDAGLSALAGVLLVVTQGGQLQLALGARALPVSRAMRALLAPEA